MAVAVIAGVSVEVDKLGLLYDAIVGEEIDRFLLAQFGVDDAKGRVVFEALQRIDLAPVAAGTLNIVMGRANEMLFDVIFMKLQLPVKNSEDREAKKAVVVHIHKREKKRNMAKHEIYENINVMKIL